MFDVVYQYRSGGGSLNKSNFPISIDLSAKKCVVVGAGRVAERKARALINNGARVHVIGTEGTPEIQQLAATDKIIWSKRPFTGGDLKGAFLTVAATDDARTNTTVYDEAVKNGALINVVDQPERCNFFFPAVVERGQLKIAITTGGNSPALAKHLRKKLTADIGPEYGQYLEVVALFRRRLKETDAGLEKIREAHEKLFDSDLLKRVKNGDNVDIEDLVSTYAG